MEEETQKELWRNLREVREAKQISKYRMARDLGISEAAIRRIEDGQGGRMDTIVRICEYLKVRLTVKAKNKRMMTEQEIVAAIATITDNYGKGVDTDPNIISADMRKAITKLYNIAYELGYKHAEAHGTASREEQESNRAKLKRENEQLRDELDDMREKSEMAEEKYRKAAETLRVAIDNMRAALYDADEQLN